MTTTDVAPGHLDVTISKMMPTVSITPAAVTIPETGGAAAVVVRRSRAGVDKELVVRLRANGSAGRGTDYDLVSGDLGEDVANGLKVTFKPGQDNVTVNVNSRDDKLVEGQEQARFLFAAADGYAIDALAGTANVYITDDDASTGAPGWNNGGGGGGTPDDDADPDAWVDVAVGGYGWWWNRAANATDAEQWYGSTDDGPGETTGAILRLNDDFDESADYDGTGVPDADLEKDGIVGYDGEVVPLWLGVWTDADAQDDEANGGRVFVVTDRPCLLGGSVAQLPLAVAGLVVLEAEQVSPIRFRLWLSGPVPKGPLGPGDPTEPASSTRSRIGRPTRARAIAPTCRGRTRRSRRRRRSGCRRR